MVAPNSDCTADESLALLEAERLYGRGLGWNDVQLLASARVSRAPLWTLDRILADAAHKLGVAFEGP
jgi:hypothetical protein